MGRPGQRPRAGAGPQRDKGRAAFLGMLLWAGRVSSHLKTRDTEETDISLHPAKESYVHLLYKRHLNHMVTLYFV